MQLSGELTDRGFYHGNLGLQNFVGFVMHTSCFQATETLAVSIKPALDVLRRHVWSWLFACVHDVFFPGIRRYVELFLLDRPVWMAQGHKGVSIWPLPPRPAGVRRCNFSFLESHVPPLSSSWSVRLATLLPGPSGGWDSIQTRTRQQILGKLLSEKNVETSVSSATGRRFVPQTR
jgi:hypothetical protein